MEEICAFYKLGTTRPPAETTVDSSGADVPSFGEGVVTGPQGGIEEVGGLSFGEVAREGEEAWIEG